MIDQELVNDVAKPPEVRRKVILIQSKNGKSESNIINRTLTKEKKYIFHSLMKKVKMQKIKNNRREN